jgi:hypothetical protein
VGLAAVSEVESTREQCARDIWCADLEAERSAWAAQDQAVKARYLRLADLAGRLATAHLAWQLFQEPDMMPGVRLPWRVPQLAALIYRYTKPPGSPRRYRSLPPEVRGRYERCALKILGPQLAADMRVLEGGFAAWWPGGGPPPPPPVEEG